MNPYFALSAIFLLGLRGIEKKLELPGPPMSHFTPEDKKNGKVRTHIEAVRSEMHSHHAGEDAIDIPGVGY